MQQSAEKYIRWHSTKIYGIKPEMKHAIQVLEIDIPVITP